MISCRVCNIDIFNIGRAVLLVLFLKKNSKTTTKKVDTIAIFIMIMKKEMIVMTPVCGGCKGGAVVCGLGGYRFWVFSRVLPLASSF